MKEPKAKPIKKGIQTDLILQTLDLSPTPLSIAPFRRDDARMTRIKYSSHKEIPVEEHVDNLMEKAGNDPGLLISCVPWHFIRPWLGSPEAAFDKFWEPYKSEEAEHHRGTAVYGPKFENRRSELKLIEVVDEYKTLSLLNYERQLKEDAPPHIRNAVSFLEARRTGRMDVLKIKMADWVLDAIWKDAEAPKRLHELLKFSKATQSEFGDKLDFDGLIFRAFVREMCAHWKLPSKKAVRKGAGKGDEQVDLTRASRAFRRLGLSGLPEG